jgi:hypothetical protein
MLISACAHTSSSEPKKEQDGSYRIDCKASLARCLIAIEKVCGQGYELIHAQEDRRFYGPDAYNQAIVTSEAIARCRKPDQPKVEAAASAPAAAPQRPVGQQCVPGATQACVGPGACRGGQQCLPDGTAFGPCDCGPGTPATPTTPVAGPASDAGITVPR